MEGSGIGKKKVCGKWGESKGFRFCLGFYILKPMVNAMPLMANAIFGCSADGP